MRVGRREMSQEEQREARISSQLPPFSSAATSQPPLRVHASNRMSRENFRRYREEKQNSSLPHCNRTCQSLVEKMNAYSRSITIIVETEHRNEILYVCGNSLPHRNRKLGRDRRSLPLSSSPLSQPVITPSSIIITSHHASHQQK